MPKGKKACPTCKAEHGARKRTCECGYEFIKTKAKATPKKVKQEGQSSSKQKPVKQTKHPLGQKYLPALGLWVFDLEKGMPNIHLPEDLPKGPINNQQVYEHCTYNGIGECVYEYIPSRKIADPKLKKLWKKAHDAMHEAWRYLIDDERKT